MKIDNSHPPQRPTQAETHRQEKATAKGAAGQPPSTPAAVAHLSQKAQDTSQDIDSLRVNEIRQAISEGRLEIRAERIADGLIKSLKEL
ncbi:flagellar biosynthesis anti-sigma factor FlgM [Halomonas salifodinae]|uniref:flagellar biosynthesis anti-sigma factor FlgM n=1 Tax=Halomonas salifodinae TaxID=438745 RepID=UPI0033A72EE1